MVVTSSLQVSRNQVGALGISGLSPSHPPQPWEVGEGGDSRGGRGGGKTTGGDTPCVGQEPGGDRVWAQPGCPVRDGVASLRSRVGQGLGQEGDAGVWPGPCGR